MKKILIFEHSILMSTDQYKATITYKIHVELSKVYELSKSVYFNKGVNPNKSNFDMLIKPVSLPLKWSNPLNKLINIFYIYLNNFKILFNEYKNSDLIWLGLTSSIGNSFVFLYPLFFSSRKFYIQLYTPSVSKSKLKRDFLDLIVKFNLIFFRYIGGASKPLIERYNIKASKTIPIYGVIPDYGFRKKNFNKLHLVYIGTLNNREVWKSIAGLGIFQRNNPHITFTYDIIGGGRHNEVEEINRSISEYNLTQSVKYHGFLSIDNVKKIFNRCNIGVSYIPLKPYFQNPSTKTVEYLLAGMAVVATDKDILHEVITGETGVFCQDNPEDFARALKRLYDVRHSFDSMVIRDKVKHLAIENMIKDKYIPNLERIIK